MKKLLAPVVATTALTAPVFAQEIEEFRIGILGGENAQDRLNNNQCLADYTAELLGVPTKLFAPADYDGVIQGLLGGTIDMAWLGASAYAKTYLSDAEAVEPVLVKVNTDGSYGYHSIGFARVDSGITSLEDMQGKVFGFGDPNSTSGYLIPSIEIPQVTGSTMESGDYFGEVKFTGQVTPATKLVEFGIDFKRVMRGRLVLGIANGWVKADGETVFTANDLRVGLFKEKSEG